MAQAHGTGQRKRVGLVASVQGEVAGYASLELERVRRSHCGSVGIAVAKGWHGQGIGSRLLGALLDVADNWMNLRRVELMVYTDNEPAIAVPQARLSRSKANCATTRCATAAMSTPTPWPGCATPTRVECRAGRWPAHCLPWR